VPQGLAEQAAQLGVPEWVATTWPPPEGGWATRSSMVRAAFDIVLSRFDNEPRIRDSIDLCSGHGEFSYWCRARGLGAHEFDKGTRHPTESLSDFHGIIWAGLLLLSVRRGGMMLAGPKCSTWLRFLSAASFGRLESIHGDVTKPAVVDANTCAETLSYLVVVACLREVFAVYEQPSGTRFVDYPCVSVAVQMTSAKCLVTWLGSFGHWAPKPTVLLTTLPDEYCLLLRRPRPPVGRTPPMCPRTSKGTTGGPHLRSSEHYPTEFCQTLAQIVAATRNATIARQEVIVTDD
jgi:hypothetical protein